MASPRAAAEAVMQSDWVAEKRADDGVVTIQTPSGNYVHFDDGFPALLRRATIAKNGFDMIPPEIASEAAESMAEFKGKPYRGRFPFTDDAGSQRWVNMEACWLESLLVCAFWPEDNPDNFSIDSALLES